MATTTNYRIEDQEPSDSPLTLEATPSGDRAYFCKLLHQKAEVLTFTFGVDGGDGPYTEYRAVRPLPALTGVTTHHVGPGVPQLPGEDRPANRPR